MAFPTYGSWISDIIPQPTSTDVLRFSASFITGSSNVEYAVYDAGNTSALIDFTGTTTGTNQVNLSSITEDYRVYFRLIGYPDDGFNPIVSDCQINYGGLGGTLQTLNVGSNVKLSTSKYTIANVELEGSYTWLAVGKVSTDNGLTWTTIPVYGLDFPLTSTTGSKPVIKLEDTTGSVVLTRILGYFHGSDIN